MNASKYAKVFFDVDSTLVTIEGIDVLAAGDPEIVALTRAAMNGEIPLDEVYGRRLDRIRPTRRQIDDLAQTYLASLLPDAKETIATLAAAGADVHLVTGGIEQAVAPLAASLGLAPRALHAVALSFDDAGGYADFDRRSPLTRPGGKELVILDVRARSKGKAALIGDGMSDAEARDAVDLFIGFGGVAVRPAVRDVAAVYVEEPRLAALLPHLLKGES